MIKVEKSKVTMQGKSDEILSELCLATYSLVNEAYKQRLTERTKIDVLTDIVMKLTRGVAQCIKEDK